MGRRIIIVTLIFLFVRRAHAQDEILLDARDGKQYKTIKIGEQVWMAQNLAYANEIDHRLNSLKKEQIFCYQDSIDYCDKYGMFYSSEAAQKACPTGWHLPSRFEFENMIKTFGDNKKAYSELLSTGHSGFNAQLVGKFYVYDNGKIAEFREMNRSTIFWTSTTGKIISRCAVFYIHRVMMRNLRNNNGFSVRCVKD